MEGLQREFLPRFAALATKRVEGAVALCAAPTEASAREIAREMHALAGEAGLLGLATVLSAARQVEITAAELAADPDDASTRDRLDHTLSELAEALRAAAGVGPPSQPRSPGKSLREKFRAQFAEIAGTRYERIVRAVALENDAGLAQAASELHTLGGEASLLAMTVIASLCRIGEDAAEQQDRTTLVATLEQLEVAIFAEDVAGGGP